jgi:hypothetical protein
MKRQGQDGMLGSGVRAASGPSLSPEGIHMMKLRTKRVGSERQHQTLAGRNQTEEHLFESARVHVSLAPAGGRAASRWTSCPSSSY